MHPTNNNLTKKEQNRLREVIYKSFRSLYPYKNWSKYWPRTKQFHFQNMHLLWSTYPQNYLDWTSGTKGLKWYLQEIECVSEGRFNQTSISCFIGTGGRARLFRCGFSQIQEILTSPPSPQIPEIQENVPKIKQDSIISATKPLQPSLLDQL